MEKSEAFNCNCKENKFSGNNKFLKNIAIALLGICVVAIVIVIDLIYSNYFETKKFTDYSFDCFDTVTTIVGYEENESEFKALCEEIKAELLEYHKLYDIYNEYEGINNLCSLNKLYDGKHKALVVDQRIIDLLLFSKEMHTLTDGKVNVVMGSVLSIWHDYREEGLDNPSNAKLPQLSMLNTANEHTDINNLIIDTKRKTVFLQDADMLIDVGAIAKGYAVERVAKSLEEKGINGYLLNVGGNVRVVGEPYQDGWLVGIQNPDTEDTENSYVTSFYLETDALVTSGSYQRYYTVNGVNYHHIIDPETLMPAEHFKSLSILCKNSGLADALSTAVFCMDYEQGVELINSMEGVSALWVLPDGTLCYSDDFKKMADTDG